MSRFVRCLSVHLGFLTSFAVLLGTAVPAAAKSTAVTSRLTSQGVATPTRWVSESRPASLKKSSSGKTIRRIAPPRYSSSRASLRRTRLARARAAAQRELRELALPRYKVDDSGTIVPDVRAEAVIAYNPVTQQVLWAENANQERSIASITKVMTAVVFLEQELDLAREVTVDSADVRGASVTYLRRGERLTVDNLLHLTLIASDNAAARSLARVSPLGPQAFIERMNTKAVELGLTHTHYTDPSGLNAQNTSSAFDMARLIAFAAADERIGPLMRKAAHTAATSRRTITVQNTNRLVGSEVDVRGGKTGFISKAGYCLATLLRLPQSEDPIAVVVLGARSNAARFWETRHILNWLATKTSQVVGVATPGKGQE